MYTLCKSKFAYFFSVETFLPYLSPLGSGEQINPSFSLIFNVIDNNTD